MSKLVSAQVSPYMLVLPAKQVRVKSGNVFADTSRAQPLQSEGAAFGLSLANGGSVIVELKSPYSDGTTHIVLSPMEFIGRLVALVPKPRVNLTRFHGVFSPNSQLRKKIVPKQAIQVEAEHLAKCQIGSKRYGMHWAQRLKRVFNIEVTKCDRCGGKAERRPIDYRLY